MPQDRLTLAEIAQLEGAIRNGKSFVALPEYATSSDIPTLQRQIKWLMNDRDAERATREAAVALARQLSLDLAIANATIATLRKVVVKVAPVWTGPQPADSNRFLVP